MYQFKCLKCGNIFEANEHLLFCAKCCHPEKMSMGRIEEIKKLADICRKERTVAVGDFFTIDDIEYLLSRIQIAEEYFKKINLRRHEEELVQDYCEQALEQIKS